MAVTSLQRSQLLGCVWLAAWAPNQALPMQLQLIGWLLQLWGLSRGMQRGTWSQAPVIRRNHSFLQSLALVMRARMLGVRAQTVKVEACVCKSATKHHLAVAWLHWPNQPNTGHVWIDVKLRLYKKTNVRMEY